MEEYKYGLLIQSKTPFTIEKQYQKVMPTSILIEHGRSSINQLYEMVDGLVHLSNRVKERRNRLMNYEDYSYLSEEQLQDFGGYIYYKEELNLYQIIKDLSSVLYKIQPTLQIQSLFGTNSKFIEDDPNYYIGHYVLNDNNDYSIIKYKGNFKIYKGNKHFYPNWKSDEDLIFEDNIDFDVYSVSLQYNELRSSILWNPQLMLKNGLDYFKKYYEVENRLEELFIKKIDVRCNENNIE